MMRLIIWAIIFYLVFSVIKLVRRLMKASDQREQRIEDERRNNSQKPYSIDQKDIVDAKFEDIKEDKDKKTGE